MPVALWASFREDKKYLWLHLPFIHLMKLKRLLLALIPLFNTVTAQNTLQPDSAITLQNIIVNAYENNMKLIDVPAAISLVNKKDLNRFNNASILSAMNNNPGVRMEERSPGSYRLSIRGSSLRSPFGVRDVKVYYDGIPYTDPGGNTYLNQLGFYNIRSVEIIKGPGSSMYGAGIGGVLLIKNNAAPFRPGASVSYNYGSYNLNNINVEVRFGNENFHNTVSYQHLTSDGYRDNTAMRRDVVTWDAVSKPNEKSEFQSHFLYADLYYQTPGALTLKQFDSIPKSARPASGPFPGSVQAKAAIYQKTFMAGFSYQHQYNDHWKNTTSVYGAYTDLKNPTIRNYEIRTEPHFGGRTVFQFNKKINNSVLTVNAGAEFQQSFNTQRDYENNNGESGSLQIDDEILNNQGFIFVEGNIQLINGWTITVGASINKYGLNFTQRSDMPPTHKVRHFNNEFTPRFALLKKFNKNVSVYGSIAKGFSSPTVSELLPSTNVFNTSLQAESGLDYELGARGSLLNNRLYFDINAFFYKLKNAIVQLQNSSGADYFDNAGSAKQNGIESFVSYNMIDYPNNFINHVTITVSNTWNNFHYDIYKQSGTDYGGKQIPGVAPETFTAGIDINTKPGIYINTNFFYSSRIALNDGNSAYASAYDLLGTRIGYKSSLSKEIQWELFTGVENIFDEKYSLGNDINAAAGRYYNLAPGRNYYAGMVFQFNRRR
jgi:iron complex outermembrane receptor protein